MVDFIIRIYSARAALGSTLWRGVYFCHMPVREFDQFRQNASERYSPEQRHSGTHQEQTRTSLHETCPCGLQAAFFSKKKTAVRAPVYVSVTAGATNVVVVVAPGATATTTNFRFVVVVVTACTHTAEDTVPVPRRA